MWTSWKTSSFTTLLRLGTFRGYEPKLSSLCITFLVSYPARYCGNWRHSVARIDYCFSMALRWAFEEASHSKEKRSGTLAKHIRRKLFFLSHEDNIWKAFSSFLSVRQKTLPLPEGPQLSPKRGGSHFLPWYRARILCASTHCFSYILGQSWASENNHNGNKKASVPSRTSLLR